MSDLAIIDPSTALERATDPGEFVVLALERGKSWLAEALAHGDLDALVNAKGYAETLRVAVVQKQLGKDAELSAQELVRRAERCIGLGIRQGQEAGEIARYGDNMHTRNVQTPHAGLKPKASPRSFATSHELEGGGGSPGIYALTDHVSNEQFEEAITEGKAEGNLSRANVVRKLKPDKVKPKPGDRHEIHWRGRRIDPIRIIEESISMLEGIASGLHLIDDVKSLDAEKRLVWLDAIREPLAAITRFTKELRG